MWPLLLAAQILAAELPHPLELGQASTAFTLIAPNDEVGRQRANSIVADPETDLVLRLREVEADADPGASWEVYVASSNKADCANVPALVGILSLYGAPPSAEFVFPLDAALTAGKPVGLEIIFEPISGLEVDGEPVPSTVRTEVRIGGISLETADAAAVR